MRTLVKATFDEALEAASRHEGTGKVAMLTDPAAAGRTLLSIQVLIMKRRGFPALIDSFWCIHSSKTSKVGGVPMLHSCCVIVYACHRFV